MHNQLVTLLREKKTWNHIIWPLWKKTLQVLFCALFVESASGVCFLELSLSNGVWKAAQPSWDLGWESGKADERGSAQVRLSARANAGAKKGWVHVNGSSRGCDSHSVSCRQTPSVNTLFGKLTLVLHTCALFSWKRHPQIFSSAFYVCRTCALAALWTVFVFKTFVFIFLLEFSINTLN